MRYSRTLPGPQYHASTAVLLSEAIKCLISLTACICTHRREETSSSTEKVYLIETSPTHQRPSRAERILGLANSNARSFARLLVPSLLYTIQNNLQFLAVSNLDAACFQVAYQGKILTTAFCAVIFLGKKLSTVQYYSIILLTAGVACASLSSAPEDSHTSNSYRQNHTLGIGAVGAACVTSGFAGVYTEALLKKTQQTSSNGSTGTNTAQSLFWFRTFQLSLSSLAFAVFGIFIVDRRTIIKDGFWTGYNNTVWATIILQAVGGITVALVITYTDNILKGFATSVSIITSTIATALIWGLKLTPLFVFGMLAVLVATHLYNLPVTTVIKGAVVDDYDDGEARGVEPRWPVERAKKVKFAAPLVESLLF